MRATKKDKLHELIKAMTPSEKRAFKIFASRHVIGSENNYVKLFDAFDKLKLYDEKKLMKNFKGKPFFKYLSAEKYYLYNLILSSLDAFHANSSIDDTLQKQLHHVEVLFGKGLYDHAAKILARCRKLAELHDKYEELLKILGWEREMAFRLTPEKGLDVFLEQHYKAINEVIGKLQNRYDYFGLSDKIFALHRTKGIVRSKADLTVYRKHHDHPLMKSEKKALSYDARRFFFGAKMYYYHAVGDLKKSHEYRRRAVELIEANEKRLVANPKTYVFALNNLMLNCILLNNEIEFHDTLNKLRNLPDSLPASARTHDLMTRIFESHYIHETDFYIKTARFEQGVELIEDIEKQLPEYLDEIDKAFELTLYNNMVCLYFGEEKYKEALRYLNKILNDRSLDMRQDIICYSRVINLIIHFELDNMITLPYLLRSTFRFLSKRKHIYRFETIILDAMKKILRSNDKSELSRLFVIIKAELEPLMEDPYEKTLFEDIDITAWLESKISGRSYAAIMQEKVLSRP